MGEPTYEQLLADNQRLRTLLAARAQDALAELVAELMADDLPLVRVKAEAYEHRVYELELAYMFAPAGSPEGAAAWEACEKVKVNYARDYPGRPMRPHAAQPTEAPPIAASSWPVAKKPRKPYTRREKPAA